MNYSKQLFAILLLFSTASHAFFDAMYPSGNNTLKIYSASYKGATYQVEMTYLAPDKLILKNTRRLSPNLEPNKAHVKTVNIPNDLNFSLSNINIENKSYQANIAIEEGSETTFKITSIILNQIQSPLDRCIYDTIR